MTGTSTVTAHTTFTASAASSLTRNTDGVGANSGPAVKTWVNAKIAIPRTRPTRSGSRTPSRSR